MTALIQVSGQQVTDRLSPERPETWQNEGLCRTSREPDRWHSTKAADIEQAKAICRLCPVRLLCRTWARETRQDWGVWGGESEKQRKAVLRAAAVREKVKAGVRACATCGQPLPDNAPPQRKFCTRACSRKPLPRVQNCGRCDQPFEPRAANARYCSKNCRDLANGKRKTDTQPRVVREPLPEKPAAGCGEPFRPRRVDYLYCTPDCQALAGHARRREKAA